jgi:hypothetical protein
MDHRCKSCTLGNQVRNELVTANTIPVVLPDLFTYFVNHQNEFSDNLHPNGDG